MANILVVDDDEIILKTVHAALVKAGHTVTLTRDGHAALQASKKEKLDLIITDINMPTGFSGYNLVKMLRDTPQARSLPIMIISTRRSEIDIQRGVEVGVNDYVIKPIDFDIFHSKVKALLSKGAHKA